jgi:hypothetical protein
MRFTLEQLAMLRHIKKVCMPETRVEMWFAPKILVLEMPPRRTRDQSLFSCWLESELELCHESKSA